MFIVEIIDKKTHNIEKIYFFKEVELLNEFLRDDIFDYDEDEIDFYVWQVAKTGKPLKNPLIWY